MQHVDRGRAAVAPEHAGHRAAGGQRRAVRGGQGVQRRVVAVGGRRRRGGGAYRALDSARVVLQPELQLEPQAGRRGSDARESRMRDRSVVRGGTGDRRGGESAGERERTGGEGSDESVHER